MGLSVEGSEEWLRAVFRPRKPKVTDRVTVDPFPVMVRLVEDRARGRRVQEDPVSPPPTPGPIARGHARHPIFRARCGNPVIPSSPFWRQPISVSAKGVAPTCDTWSASPSSRRPAGTMTLVGGLPASVEEGELNPQGLPADDAGPSTATWLDRPGAALHVRHGSAGRRPKYTASTPARVGAEADAAIHR